MQKNSNATQQQRLMQVTKDAVPMENLSTELLPEARAEVLFSAKKRGSSNGIKYLPWMPSMDIL